MPTWSVSRARGEAAPCEVADQDGGDRVVERDPWQLGVVLERRRAVRGWSTAGRPRAGRRAVAAVATGGLLGVGDAVAGGHEVELSGPR